MDPLQSLHIVDLLREREGEFVRVWECEQAIQALLHGAFRFDPPPDLPSRRRGGRRTPPRPQSAPRLRRLRGDREHAYLVRYEHPGGMAEGLSTNVEFLRTLLEQNPAALRVHAVRTARLAADGEAVPVATLWERDAGASAE